jgi:hypothetical protein
MFNVTNLFFFFFCCGITFENKISKVISDTGWSHELEYLPNLNEKLDFVSGKPLQLSLMFSSKAVGAPL